MSRGRISEFVKTVWIIDAEHWPRALLRGELIERGCDAIGFVAVDDALRTIPSRWPGVIVVEIRTLARREAERLFGASIPVIGIAPASHEPWIDELPFVKVLRRPVSIGEIADFVLAH
jgi:hypothetical protein